MGEGSESTTELIAGTADEGRGGEPVTGRHDLVNKAYGPDRVVLSDMIADFLQIGFRLWPQPTACHHSSRTAAIARYLARSRANTASPSTGSPLSSPS